MPIAFFFLIVDRWSAGSFVYAVSVFILIWSNFNVLLSQSYVFSLECFDSYEKSDFFDLWAWTASKFLYDYFEFNFIILDDPFLLFLLDYLFSLVNDSILIVELWVSFYLSLDWGDLCVFYFLNTWLCLSFIKVKISTLLLCLIACLLVNTSLEVLFVFFFFMIAIHMCYFICWIESLYLGSTFKILIIKSWA